MVVCALFAAVLALLAALLAAPFMTVREPLLACTKAMPHRPHRSYMQLGVAGAYTTGYDPDKVQLINPQETQPHLQLKAGLPERATEKALL